jgi:cardiolipin synthase
MFLATGCSAPLVRDIPMLSPEDPHFDIRHMYAVRSPQFRRAVGYLLGPQILEGNRVATLLNGDQIFPAMLEAIKSAQRSITFETFIYWLARSVNVSQRHCPNARAPEWKCE